MKRAALSVGLGLILLLSACVAKPAPTATATPLPPTTAPTAQAPTPTAVAPTPTAAAPEACTDRAAFVEDVTVPDYSHFDVRQAFTKTWRVKNVGTCTWTASYSAVYSQGDALGAPISIALTETAPGATADISTIMTAPSKDGKYEIFYRLSNESGDAMPIDDGDSIWALITVGKVKIYPAPTATSAPASVSSSSTGAGLATVNCGYKPNPDFVSQTLVLLNAARAANGLPALTGNDKLNTAAQSHSADMACNNFLSHTGWNGSTVGSRIAAAGYTASSSVENIYAQPPQYGGNPQAAVDWWMSDPTHRDAILSAQASEVGIGYAAYTRSDLGGYFTVDFAAP